MAFIAGGLIIGGLASVAGGAIAAKGANDAAKTAAAGGERDIEFQRESRDLARADQAPYRKAGYTALDALMSMTGLSGGRSAAPHPKAPLTGLDGAPAGFNAGGKRFGGSRASGYAPIHQRYAGGPTRKGTIYNVHELGPESVYANGAVTRGKGPATIDGQTGYVEPNIEGRYTGGPINRSLDIMGEQPAQINTANSTAINPNTGYPNENPGGVEGGYNFMTEPGYQFRVSEGQRALDRSAAARGGLLSGGFARKAIRYGQGFASQEYSNVYNRIANIAGLGQTGATASGNYAMMAGQGMGNSASNAANATAYGQIGAGNAWANAGNQIAQMPWDKFQWGSAGGSDTRPVYDFQGRRIQYD